MFILTLPIIIMMLAAVVPGVVLLYYIYKQDSLDKEPPALLAKLFVLGIISTVCAIFTENVGTMLFGTLLGDGLIYKLIFNFIVIGLSEEGFKYLVLKRATWNNSNFNCSFDGVVYAVFVSLGFAVWENVQYVFSYGLGTALLRAVTAIPGHTCFGVLMGACYAAARRAENIGDVEGAKQYKRMSVIVPLIAHGAYDFFAGIGGLLGSILFVAVIAVIFTFSFRLAKNLARGDEYIV